METFTRSEGEDGFKAEALGHGGTHQVSLRTSSGSPAGSDVEKAVSSWK